MFHRLIVLLTALTLVTSRKHSHFYRKDYTYFEDYDAFYKLFWDMNGLSWTSAFMACEDEGAKLFYPKEEGEWTVVKTLTAKLPVAPNVSEIFVGFHDEYGLGEYITIDGHSTPAPLSPFSSEDQIVADGQHCVIMDIETGMYTTDLCASSDIARPFVCKKIDGNPCPTVDTEYVYEKVTKKCYKVNNRQKTWQEAMQTCFVEGGTLVTIDNQVESKILFDKLRDNDQWYFVGFRRGLPHRDFYTIRGEKFTSGYYRWYSSENIDENDNCGVMRPYSDEMYTFTRSCTQDLPFVCEMEPVF